MYSGGGLQGAPRPSIFPQVSFHTEKTQAHSPDRSHSTSEQKILTKPKLHLWPCLCTDALFTSPAVVSSYQNKLYKAHKLNASFW